MKDPDAAPPRQIPILLVDDEPAALSLLKATLEHAGYEVIGHTSPVQALEEIKHRTFSVIISDQRMPELSGLELLAQAAHFQPNATRVLVTAVLHLDTVID